MAKISWFVGGKRHKRRKSNGMALVPAFRKVKLTMIPLGAGLGGPDPDKERDPPPRPTPATFPVHNQSRGSIWGQDVPPPNFQALFSKVLKPSDLSERHIEALNISILPPCAVDDLVPLAANGTSYLPPPEANKDTDAEWYANDANSDVCTARKRKELDDRLSELRIDNDLAFRTLSKTVTSGVKPPRLAFMRKFWEGLEGMAQYWDCGQDHYYYETINDGDDETKSAKRQRLENGSVTLGNERAKSLPEAEHTVPILQIHGVGEAYGCNHPEVSGQEQTPAQQSEGDRKTRSTSATPEPRPRSRLRYKGRRTSTGSEMPDQFRVDTVRAFVEGTIWPFHTGVYPPRIMPIIQFGKLNLPIRQTAAVYRVPKDRIRGRQGWLEGPILGLQVRPEIEFHGENGQDQKGKGRLDLLREISALLQLAQERQREGKTETKPGEGMWWTTKPRWGGGPGGEAQNEIGNSDVVQAAEELLSATQEKNGKREKYSTKGRKRKTPALLWKELKCGRGFWDPKTEYTAIGKDPDSECDEAFLVSSLNHHISILKLTVHVAYIDYLTSGLLPHPRSEDVEWCRPRLQRSTWFNLFNAQQRVEAFRGLWGVIAYLTRDTQSESK